MNLFLYLNYYYSFSDLPDDPKADWDTHIGGQIITEYIKHNQIQVVRHSVYSNVKTLSPLRSESLSSLPAAMHSLVKKV